MEKLMWRLWRSEHFFARLARGLLKPLSWPWQFLAFIRNTLYDNKLLKTYRPPMTVISVGNITVGGTGKTPLIIALAGRLLAQGRSVTILTRGYKTEDEARLMAHKLPGACIIVAKDRVKGAKKAASDVLILDDGLQRRDIERDVEIVCLDEMDPLGCNSFIPSGFLRDSPRSLQRAHFLVGPQNEKVRKYTAAPILTPVKRLELIGPKHAFGLFAAVADPSRVERTAREMGLDVVYVHGLSDHAPLSKKLLEHIFERAQARGAKGLVCTEKDWVKIPWTPSMPISVIKLEIEGIDPLVMQ